MPRHAETLPTSSLYEILQILSLAMFETTPINQLLPNSPTNSEPPIAPIQGVLL